MQYTDLPRRMMKLTSPKQVDVRHKVAASRPLFFDQLLSRKLVETARIFRSGIRECGRLDREKTTHAGSVIHKGFGRCYRWGKISHVDPETLRLREC